MIQVNNKYKLLCDTVEIEAGFKAHDAAAQLKAALESPAIAVESPYAENPEFQALYRDAQEKVEAFAKDKLKISAESLTKARGEISSACLACHDKFRPD